MDAIHTVNIPFLKNYLESGDFNWLSKKIPLEISYFSSGWWTHLYLIKSGNDKFLARINFFPGKNDWKVKRIEFSTLKEIAHLNISPKAYLLDEDNELHQDFTIVGYVEWENIETFRDSDIIALAKDLHLLHSIPRSSENEYRCRIYDEFAWGADKMIEHYDFPEIDRVFAKYNTIKEGLGEWFNALAIFDGSENLCLCHADLKSENILRTHQGIMLIDWECADTDIPETDIGRLFAGCEFTKEQQDLFLKEYYGIIPSNTTRSKIHVVKLVLDFFRIIENYCIHKRKPFDADRMIGDLDIYEQSLEQFKRVLSTN